MLFVSQRTGKRASRVADHEGRKSDSSTVIRTSPLVPVASVFRSGMSGLPTRSVTPFFSTLPDRAIFLGS